MSVKKYLLGVLIVPALFAGSAFAGNGGYTEDSDTARVKVETYSIDAQGNIVKSNVDECWRTTGWTRELAIKECDPHLFPDEQVVKAPEPVAKAPEPVAKAPKVAPERAPMLPRKMTFSADALFGFDSAELKPHGKVALEEFISHLWDVQYDMIIVTGYTDRLGAKAYNKRLSVRRAESVKAYIGSNGINPRHIFADGKGEANSETGTYCDNVRRGPDLIECLTPDRRVEIEVTGTH
jgi:OOP family OmpA-OmpF porin